MMKFVWDGQEHRKQANNDWKACQNVLYKIFTRRKTCSTAGKLDCGAKHAMEIANDNISLVHRQETRE